MIVPVASSTFSVTALKHYFARLAVPAKYVSTMYFEFARQFSQAFARPAQRLLRITARSRLNQRLQVGKQGGILLDRRLAPATGAAYTAAELVSTL